MVPMTIGGLRHTGILKSHRHLLRRTHWLIFMYGLARKILEKFHLLTQVPRGGRRLIPLLYTSHKCTIRNLASLSDTWSKSDVPTDIRKNFEVPGGLGTTNAKLVYCITIVWVDPIKLIGSRQVRVPARCEWRAGPPNIILISCNHHRRLDEQIRSSNISLDPQKKMLWVHGNITKATWSLQVHSLCFASRSTSIRNSLPLAFPDFNKTFINCNIL